MDKERPDSRPGQGKDQVAQKKSTQSTTKTKASPAEPAQTKSAVSAPGKRSGAKNNATGPRTSSTAAPRPPPAAHVQLGFGNIGMPFFMGFPPLLNADLTAAGPNATTNDRINAWNPVGPW